MSRAAHISFSSSLCLNPNHTVLYGWPPSSPSKPPWSELFKLITSNHAPLPKLSQNQITTTTTAETQSKSNRNKNPKAHTSQIKSHPPKSKHKTHKTTKITKWKHWKWTHRSKNIYWFCYYILEEESYCWTNFKFKLIKHIPQARMIDWKQSKKNGISQKSFFRK